MEPDVIRMYSSSPPPLDDGAEEEEDEFGDFGGFSGVSTSGAGFGEIESSEFTNSTDFIPPNHFLPVHDYSNNVNSFANFSSVKGSESSDFSRPVGESFNSLISSTSNEITLKSSKIVLDGTTNKEDKQKSVEQTEIVTMPNHLTTNILSRTHVTVLTQEQNIDSYNGDEIAYTEIVTNGFATFDPQNPPGTEDLDSTSDSKALKTISTHSTGLSLDSTPSPAEDLSDFSSFQNADELADHFLTKELEHKVSRDLDEGKTFNTQDNITANSNNELNFVGQVIANASYKNEGVADTEYKQCCSSDHSTVFDEGSSNKGEIAKSDMPMDSDIHSAELPASTSLDTVPHAAHGAETREMCENKYETPHSEKEEFRVSPRVMEGSISNGQEQTTDSDVKADNDFNDFGAVNAEFSSFGQALSSDATEDDFGDFGTLNNAPQSFTKSVQEPAASVVPTKESAQTHEPADEFGDFGGMGTVGDQGFADFFQTAPTEQLASNRSDPEFSDFGTAPLMQANESDGDFGDFDSVSEQKSADNFAAFQEGVTFADFSSAGGNHTTDWNAFGDEQEDDSSWAAFGDEQTAHSNKDETWQPTRTEASSASDGLQTSRTETAQLAPSQRTASHGCAQQLQPAAQASLLIRIEHIFQACFTSVPVLKTEEAITSLKQLLQPGDKPIEAGGTLPHHGELLDVWTELQDIHDAYGLRYQWGGSNSNKKLLCSLGIDTRNILFTGNKKQPVIVPMYAAGLGMLEPTKEPLKPISAAEKIASIGQVLPISPEMSSCTSEQTQESLPPVQFDWSSSGLTNPLDGVDPELYELTTAKLETASTTNRVTDAFARLMSTVEKASTSTRKPKKEENLGKEAAKVIASLPDLSFMHAKVLMFPATLTPSISCQEKAD